MTLDLPALNPVLQKSIQRALAGRLSIDRRQLLERAAQQIADLSRDSEQPVNLLFVCTHNSRRSQFGQVWAAVAAEYYGLAWLEAHSCGTEQTACHPNTVAALKRAGLEFKVEKSEKGDAKNPRYSTRLGKTAGIELYSKAFGHSSLPSTRIVAMMCCDDADANCPVVPGADAKIPLHYIDPKRADGSPIEAQAYDECCQMVACEMFYLFQVVRGESQNATGE